MPREYWIHPAIGIARVGDSDEHFLGPEVPGQAPDAGGSYKDAAGRIKRQAQRFRIYEYEVDGSFATPVREITAEHAKITWRVHLVNRKGALNDKTAMELDTRPARQRNPDVPPERATIDPGATSVTAGEDPQTLVGKFLDTDVELGTVSVEDSGRLVVLGGRGKADGPPPPPGKDLNFANNDGWYDDTSDGAVSAEIVLDTGKESTHQGARIIVAPPAYAPAIENVVTLYDAVLNAAWRMHPSAAPRAVEPDFDVDILPILRRTVMLQWTSANASRGHRRGGGNFLDEQQLARLRNNDRNPESEAYRGRRGVFGRLVVPSDSTPPSEPLPGNKNMPMLAEIGTDTSLTPLQYEMLRQWSLGIFTIGGLPDSRTDVQREVDDLDRGAIEPATGAPWFPGIEAWSLLARPDTYDRPFRVKSSIGPGYLTLGNALPWQADFHACSIQGPLGRGEGWWPSQRPNFVVREVDGQLRERQPWVPDSWSAHDMVARWAQLGFVVQSNGRYIEADRNIPEEGLIA
jgi:hypothetical protein